ncbi:MAG TPA: peptidase M50 [Methanoregulaceae archaeon]|jgi:Zn-dependent protease|nr:peptidase M50 [Methanolinea sp.]MCC7567882.1 peptidase M50 [Methanoregulaceae archaeon]MDD3091053.1 peptidase M50 [Methanoregulaceae archaeon]MDD5049052.1 peptidase M50 [Methanoregulaceae archaeon]HOP66166.1 peptidase M50 [Methanoregulaceae archaeon]
MLERISVRERRDLLVAWVAISIAFSLIYIRYGATPALFLLFLGISLVTVGVGFILHELAHKFTAMKYGFWAEFQKNNLMLVVAVALAALAGVVFAAPGATMIYAPSLTREQNGKISAAGPVTNLLLCIPFALILFLGSAVDIRLMGLNVISTLGMIGLQVNAMIAAFNMLPVSVLDGKKVLAWNPVVFVVLIGASFGILLATFYLI